MVKERAVLVGQDRSLVGIITEPSQPVDPRPVAFVFLNAGVVHRVAPNRFHVTAARQLAQMGFLSIRFDASGLGDSGSRRDTLPFEQAAVAEAREVMSQIQREYGVTAFVTAGLCSGAVLAFRAAVADERVLGAVLLNPQGFVLSPEWTQYVANRTLARRYWRWKLFSAASWRRALTGQSNYRKLAGVLTRRLMSVFAKPDEAVSRIARGLSADFERLENRGARLLLACSEGDYGVDHLSAILGDGFDRRDVAWFETLTLPSGDHSLTLAQSQERFFAALLAWARPWSDALREPTSAAGHVGASRESLSFTTASLRS